MNRSWTGQAAVVLALLGTSVACGQGQVDVVWDRYGVPHVSADTDAGAFYGAGYAMARDRLFQMHWNRLIYQGRTAEFFGPGPANKNVKEDKKARLLGWGRHADRVVATLPREQRALLQAFSDGVNAYATSQTARIHPLFRVHGIPVEAWQPRDCVGVWTRLARYFGGLAGSEARARHVIDDGLRSGASREDMLAEILGDGMRINRAAVVQQRDVPASLQREQAEFARRFGVVQLVHGIQGDYTPAFSQAMVVAGTRTASRRALLLGEPRVAVHAPNLFFELHMRGATFDARGMAMPGVPYFLSGSTPTTAWSPTAMGLDQADLFRLTVEDSRPGEYQLDGRWLRYAVEETEVIAVKGGQPQQQVYRETVWGPVVDGQIVADIRTGEVYALKAVPFATPDQHALGGFLALYQADNVDEVYEALGGWSWPSANVVFADARGRIGYAPVGTVPIRKAFTPLAGHMALDGDTLANDWQGFLPHRLRPHVIDPSAGHLVTANHLPVGSWYSMRGLFPGLGDGTRSRRLKELLSSTALLDKNDMRRIHLDAVGATKRDLVKLALFMRDTQGVAFSTEAASALRILEGWLTSGARLDATHGGVRLADHIRETLRRVPDGAEVVERWGSGQSGMTNFLEERLRGLRLVPPQLPTPGEALAVQGFLEEAMTRMLNAAPELRDAPLDRLLQHYVKNALSGSFQRWTALGQPNPVGRGEVAYGPLIAVSKATNLAQTSDCYTQLVEVGQRDGGESMLALGQSEHEGDPHELDQQRLWERGELKPAPFSDAGVRALGVDHTTRLRYP